MCHGVIDLRDLEAQHRIDFAVYFSGTLDRLHELCADGLVRFKPDSIEVTPRGRFSSAQRGDGVRCPLSARPRRTRRVIVTI